MPCDGNGLWAPLSSTKLFCSTPIHSLLHYFAYPLTGEYRMGNQCCQTREGLGWCKACACTRHRLLLHSLNKVPVVWASHSWHDESMLGLTSRACAALPADCSILPFPPTVAELSACCAPATLLAAVTTDPSEFRIAWGLGAGPSAASDMP